jgi:hypothetical protein
MTPKIAPWLVVLPLLAACGSSGSSGEQQLAAGRIGSSGGELRIDSGPQAGLVLTVPAGALPRDTLVRVIQVTLPPAAPENGPESGEGGGQETSTVSPPGLPFRIEPVDVIFAEPLTLRAPFAPEVLTYRTGLGNVRVRQQSITASWDREPTVVDVTGRFVETRLTIGGTFQVVQGPSATSLQEYFVGSSNLIQLDNGAEFRVDEVTDPVYGSRTFERWRLTLSPLFRDFALLREGGSFAGRQSFDAGWLELWEGQSNDPQQLRHLVEGFDFGADFNTDVYNPISTPLPIGGSAALRTAWSFGHPRTVAGQRCLDVLELRLGVRWNRIDIAPGEEQLTFWFARGLGLVAVRDGSQTYTRTLL